ncbi:glycosyltransferase family 2 protein [Edwardsiella hoshinae]|uniref:glycosyltransferase family 2 protein n=1 Tax=Edwardsiella hoshinae TaxID=93378 RepID=UPI001428AA49|nr:glycosyltransferase family 2 protein [Edwardsiella hoshinae]
MDALVSVILPAYNASGYLRESIESVLKQSYSNLELIIVNDGSTDSTYDVAMSYLDDCRVKVINLRDNRGVANARNEGIKVAKGDYLAFIDSDDLWYSSKIEKQLSFMIINDINVCHTGYFRVSSRGEKYVKQKLFVSYNDMLKNNCIGNLTGMYKVAALGKVFQKQIRHEDYEMWLRITEKYPSIGIDIPLAKYIVRDGSISSWKLRSALWHYRILNSELRGSKFRIIANMIFYIFINVKKRIFK